MVSNGVRCSKNGVRCSLLCSTFYLLCSQPPVVFAVVFACCSVRTLFCSALRSCYVRRFVRMQIVVFAVLFALDLLVGLNSLNVQGHELNRLFGGGCFVRCFVRLRKWTLCSLFVEQWTSCSLVRVRVRWTFCCVRRPDSSNGCSLFAQRCSQPVLASVLFVYRHILLI